VHRLGRRPDEIVVVPRIGIHRLVGRRIKSATPRLIVSVTVRGYSQGWEFAQIDSVADISARQEEANTKEARDRRETHVSFSRLAGDALLMGTPSGGFLLHMSPMLRL